MRDVSGSQDHYYLLKNLYTVKGLTESNMHLECLTQVRLTF